MLESDKVFAGSVPENYDRYMVPLIFAPYAADLAQRAASFSPAAVLEIAAGTGVVTRTLAPKLATSANYIVTDLNQPMLDYAASRQLRIVASSGARRMLSRCRLKMRLSTSSVVSLARCSFPTARLPTAKQSEC
jgi:predicted O-methyltransferase YrrM